MDYDKSNIAAMYNRGRDHGPAFLEQWMKVVARHLDRTRVHDILDLGCGTGRFSQGLAVEFDADVIGLDPSRKMLAEALKSSIGGRVFHANAVAEALPLQAESIDMIFISMVFHHFKDPHLVAEECRRTLRSDGRVCLRTGSSEKISLYPYVPFFPASRDLLEQRLPSLAFQREVFEAAGFQIVSSEVVTQVIAEDYSAYADKLAAKADSILASLNDDEFEAGLQAVRSHAAATAPQAVSEPIDFIVFSPPLRGGWLRGQ
jgi:ubiquinone/menaquinone biosynthesis C-methylase UbiE